MGSAISSDLEVEENCDLFDEFKGPVFQLVGPQAKGQNNRQAQHSKTDDGN
ncbi:MAG: hypothetical protein ACI9KK_002071 [Ascidiaceihabitans sp.]|jgi:hypothetical protein